jgi:hypothetical protein
MLLFFLKLYRSIVSIHVGAEGLVQFVFMTPLPTFQLPPVPVRWWSLTQLGKSRHLVYLAQ